MLPQNNACLSCICLHKNLAYLSFSQLVKNTQTTFGEGREGVEIRRFFFSHRQTKRQNCQKQSFSRQKSSKYCVFCLVTYSSSMLPLNKTCLYCFFLLKTNTIDNLAFFRKPLQNNVCLSCIYLHKNLAYLSFSQLRKTGKQLLVKTEGCVEIRRSFA